MTKDDQRDMVLYSFQRYTLGGNPIYNRGQLAFMADVLSKCPGWKPPTREEAMEDYVPPAHRFI